MNIQLTSIPFHILFYSVYHVTSTKKGHVREHIQGDKEITVKLEDAASINEMRRMDGVRENTQGIFSERVSRSEDFIKGLSEYEHLLVAEVNENEAKKVVGLVGLHVNRNIRYGNNVTY